METFAKLQQDTVRVFEAGCPGAKEVAEALFRRAAQEEGAEVAKGEVTMADDTSRVAIPEASRRNEVPTVTKQVLQRQVAMRANFSLPGPLRWHLRTAGMVQSFLLIPRRRPTDRRAGEKTLSKAHRIINERQAAAAQCGRLEPAMRREG